MTKQIIKWDMRIPASPKRACVFLGLALMLASCQSNGQQPPPAQNNPQRDPSRRQPPEEIMKALPVRADTALATAHFLFLSHGPVERADVKTLAEHSEAAAEKIIRFTGFEKKLPRFDHHLYISSEEKGLMLRNVAQSNVDFEKNEAHTVLNEIYRDNLIGMENELVLRHILGKPSSQALACGLAVYFTDAWQKRGYDYWVSRLAASGIVPSLADLFNDDNWEHCSQMIAGAYAATMVDFLIETWGKAAFLEKYPAWQPSPGELQGLEKKWRQFIETKPQAPGPRPQTSDLKPQASLPYLKGFNFSHEGYAIYNGYGSRKSDEALGKVAGLAANAVALVPYSFIRDPNEPVTLPVVDRAGSESDESVIHTAFYAQKRGLKVMLKPQIWLGRGFWTGDIRMTSEQSWQAFFSHYTYWIAHYAILAELYGYEIFCIGNEMVQTTLEREADWREVIRKVRGLYTGKLVYAANWGDEFENVGFWDDLDFIGLNCYYPLSQEDNPSDRELEKGFAAVLQKIQKVHKRFPKPLLFTEIGFPSNKQPWKEPHRDRREDPYDGEQQRRCYEIVFKNIQGKPWCHGIFWWKFPSDLDRRSAENPGFTPHNKPAEEVVKAWFGN